MPLARIADVGSSGVIYDQFPAELPPGAWSDGMNARFSSDGYAHKGSGYVSTLGTPTVAPYGLFYSPNSTTRLWTYFGLAASYVTDGTTHTVVTRTTGGAYTGTADDKWTGQMLSGILIATNGVDVPQSFIPHASNVCINLANFPASTTCKAIRAFKNHLVALDLTTSGTRYPFLVHWSHPADPGSLPSSWDHTDTTKDSGRIDLADTSGEVVDGGALNDVFIVWKQNACYALRYVGPPYIFNAQKITDQSGILGRNCWCETPMGLVALTLGDVVLHVGDQAPRSIIDKRNRRWLFANLSTTYPTRAFVMHVEDRSEVIVAFPSTASTGGCDKALVWNYSNDTWAPRDLPNVTSAAIGYIASSSVTWDSLSSTGWDSSTSIWDEGAFTLALPTVVTASPTNTKTYALDAAETADGTAQTTRLERSGMHFDAPDRVKFVRAIRPRIDGATGATVNVYVGGSMDVDAAPTWAGPYTFTVGSTLKVDCLVSGRYIGVRFESATANQWRIRSFDIDVEVMGSY